jgi:hypothetical protein
MMFENNENIILTPYTGVLVTAQTIDTGLTQPRPWFNPEKFMWNL